MTGFCIKPRSIIITDMLHRPAHLLCILSGFYHFMPLLQCLFCISSRPFQTILKQAYCGAPTSWLHIPSRPVCHAILSCQNQFPVWRTPYESPVTVPAYAPHISGGYVSEFFYPPPPPHHTFFEPFLLGKRQRVVVRLILSMMKTPPPAPSFVYMG